VNVHDEAGRWQVAHVPAAWPEGRLWQFVQVAEAPGCLNTARANVVPGEWQAAHEPA
jgi:hypothetical protein